MKDLFRFGRSSTSATGISIAKVKEIVTENPHSCLREIAAELSVSQESICIILNNHFFGFELCCHSASSKTPGFLQKLNCLRVAKNMLE